MYFWNIDRLRESLISGSLSERSRFFYLILFVALYELPLLLDDQDALSNGWGIATTLISIAGTLIGSAWLYRVNGGESGSNFLERYLSLSFVYFLRLLAVYLPAVFVAYGAAFALDCVTDGPGPLELIFTSVFVVLYYLGLSRQMRLVVAGAAAQQFKADQHP